MAGLTPAQMAALGAVNGYAAGSNPQAAQGAATMAGMGAMTSWNPYAAGINAVGNIAAAALADNTPMTMTAPQTAMFDNSGWAVTVGDGSNSTVDQIKTPNPTAAALAQAVGGINPLILLLIVGGGLAVYMASR